MGLVELSWVWLAWFRWRGRELCYVTLGRVEQNELWFVWIEWHWLWVYLS